MNMSFLQWVGSSCGQHGPYTFYKAFRFSHEGKPRILSLGEFFFLRYEPEAPLCLGELQLLWEDHNNQQLLSSSRLYFLPEDTPQGRDEEHGQHEVVAVSQKLILRVQDLASWTCSGKDWPHGLVVLPEDTGKGLSAGSLAERIQRFSLNGTLNISDVQKERQETGAQSDDEPSVIVLSYPRYCRFRAIKRRLAAVANPWLRGKLSAALGGFSVVRKTHIMYCQDSFHHHDLYDHPHICDELAPNLKGRPRKKHRLKLKHKDGEKHVLSGEGRGLKGKGHWDGKLLLKAEGNSRTRKQVDREEEAAMLTQLFKFMKDRGTPISRIPSLGFKQIDLYLFFSLAQKIGGYEKITEKRMWKHIYDKLGGNPGSTSAATCTRRHYEKLLMPFERYLRGEKDVPPPPIKHRARKQKDAEDKAVRAKIKDLIKKNEDQQPGKSLDGTVSALASTTESTQPASTATVATTNTVSVSGAHGKESLVKLSIPSVKPSINPGPPSTHKRKPMQQVPASGSPHVVAIEIQRPGVAPPPLTSATRKAQPLPANRDVIRGRSTAPLQPSQAVAPLQKSIRPSANVSVNNSEKAASAYVSSRENVPVSTTSKSVPLLSDSELVLELTTKKDSQGSLVEGKVVTTPNSRLQGERRMTIPGKPLYPPPPLIKDGNHRSAVHAEAKPEPTAHIHVKSSPAVTNPAPGSVVKVFVPERRQANAPEVKVNPTRSTRSPPVSRSEPANSRPSVIQHTQKVKPTSAIHPDDLILRQMSQQRDHGQHQKLMRPSNSMTGHKRTLPPTEQLERHYMSQLLAAQAMAGQLELEAYYPLAKRPRVDSPSFGKENADAKYYSQKFQTFFPEDKGAQSECLQPGRSADDSDQPTDLSLPKSKVSEEEGSSRPVVNDNRQADQLGSNLRDLSALQEGLPANLSHKLKSETERSGGEAKPGLSKITVSIPGGKHDDKRPAHTKTVVSVPPSVILTTSPSKTTSSMSRSHTESTPSHQQIVIPDYNPNLPRRMDVRDGVPHVMITDYNPNLPKAPLLMPEYSPHLHSPPYAHPHLLMHSPQGQVQLSSHPAGVYAGHFHSAMYEEMLRQHLIGTHAYPMQLPHPSMFPHLPEGSFPPHMYHSN
ncbi:uncharacterized protein LOC144869784 isoform X1 [Branchiostoma floridae x Branchiostoma japonicum]